MRTCVRRARHLLVVTLLAAPTAPALSAEVDFAREVAPILEQHCLRCHKPGNEKGEVSLATAESLHERGYLDLEDPDASYLLQLVTPSTENERPEMPKEGEPLTPKQRDTLRRWIAAGAPWPTGLVLKERSAADRSWWSLQPLAGVEPPDVSAAPPEWQSHPIDRFIYAAMAEKGLRPSPPASPRDLIRRATYDVLGLPPTPEEVADFEADTSPEAWERLIDRLLQSPHYGEHWGRHWLDVVRFGESRGFERNEIINTAWPFRDYVIRSFNDDKPFDRLVREHLAGDVMEGDDPSATAATTFLVCGPFDDVTNQDAAQAAQIRANTIDEIIRGTTEAFLGLTVGCARCHDHKFDPIAQTDYYALYATFAGVKHGERETATPLERQQHAERIAPLEQLRDHIARQIDVLEASILKRAEERVADIEQQWTRPPIQRTLTEESFAPTEARFVRLVVEGAEKNPEARSGYRIDEFEVWTSGDVPQNVALASAGGCARGDSSRVAGDFANAYSADLTNDGRYGARWFADGPTLTLELADVHSIDRVVFSSDRVGDAGSHDVAMFVSEYRIELSSDGATWTTVASSHDRQPINDAHRRHRLMQAVITDEERSELSELRQRLREVNRQIAAVPALPKWWVGNFSRPEGPFHVFLGGDPQRPGARVTPASLSLVEGLSVPDADMTAVGEARAALAEWIVDPRNPLTPRVLVNRVWHYHFGTGIVDTPSDFGAMGGRPTHPRLLDWLAKRLVTPEAEGGFGWRLKPLHKLVMTSQTYRQSSAHRETAAAVDADSRLLWRFPPRRLAAEEIRDTMLAVSGRLDTTMGGPGFRLYRYLEDNVATYVPLETHGPETYRRAVYHQNARASVIDLMSDFDQPDCAFPTPRRAATTTPLQALTMLNHSFTLDMAAALAARLVDEAGDDPAAQVDRAFRLAFARPPEREEREASVALIAGPGLRAFCRVLLNTNELIYLK